MNSNLCTATRGQDVQGKRYLSFPDREEMIGFFRKTSKISKMLMSNPGTYEMLEAVYTEESGEGEVDKYLLSSVSAQALRNRLSAVITWLKRFFSASKGQKMLNLGSGTARDTLGAVAISPVQYQPSFVDCVDCDRGALRIAENIARMKEINRIFKFTHGNLTQLPYRDEIDLGLLIGILCGLEHRVCVALMRSVRKYFRSGGIVVASNVLQSMLEKDHTFAQILREIIGWKLVYKTPQEVEDIFEEAGYKWAGCFFDEPTRFHVMGIGIVP